MAFRGSVLLVSPFDDRIMYAEYLRAQSLRVFEAVSLGDALRRIEVTTPDVVVTDFVFGKGHVDGPSVVRGLRATVDDLTSIIVVSGYIRREDREQAREAGADTFLAKPALPRDVLYNVLRALISRHDQQRLEWNELREPMSAEVNPFAHERRHARAS